MENEISNDKKIDILISDAKFTLELYLGTEQAYSRWQNYVMVGQSILFIAMVSLLSNQKLLMAIIFPISGTIFTWVFWLPHIYRRVMYRKTRVDTLEKTLEKLRSLLKNKGVEDFDDYFRTFKDQEKAGLDYRGLGVGRFGKNIAILLGILWGVFFILILCLIIYQSPGIKELIFDP